MGIFIGPVILAVTYVLLRDWVNNPPEAEKEAGARPAVPLEWEERGSARSVLLHKTLHPIVGFNRMFARTAPREWLLWNRSICCATAAGPCSSLTSPAWTLIIGDLRDLTGTRQRRGETSKWKFR